MSAVSATVNEADVQRELLRSIASLRFGTVEVTVHNGRIVQIERREKIRFNGDADGPKPAQR